MRSCLGVVVRKEPVDLLLFFWHPEPLSPLMEQLHQHLFDYDTLSNLDVLGVKPRNSPVGGQQKTLASHFPRKPLLVSELPSQKPDQLNP